MNKTILISQGGCGTNWLKARYGTRAMCAGFADTSPHQRFPWCQEDTRILYLSANPIDQLRSFEKKGFFSNNAAVKNLGGNELAFRRIHDDGPGTLQKYAELGVNCFEYAEHRQGWQSYALRNNRTIRFVCWEMLRDTNMLKDLDRWVMGNREPNYYPFSERSDKEAVITEEALEMLLETHEHDIHDFNFLMNTYAVR